MSQHAPAALEHDWDPANEAFLNALVAVGHPSTPGFFEAA